MPHRQHLAGGRRGTAKNRSVPDRAFALAARDELWIDGTLTESRLTHGTARSAGTEIVASDEGDEELIRICDRTSDGLRPLVAPLSCRVRTLVRVTREEGPPEVTTLLIATIADVSIVSTPAGFTRDLPLLRQLVSVRGDRSASAALPMAWSNGSAAVLLHEAAGHAAEHAALPVEWPAWLSVEDRSAAGAVDLLAGRAPLARRRASFSDVPMQRLSRVVVEQKAAPFSLPDRRIDIQLVSGGRYDPLTGQVTVHVAIADEVTGSAKARLRPFTVVAGRVEVARSLRGATGEPIRYPGVICSREGQEVYVASDAPLMLTDSLPIV
jgi:hypothetical protein